MSRIALLARSSAPIGDVIFVHGLGGTGEGSWGFGRNSGWSNWIARNRPDLNVWSIEYQVAPSEWTGGAMPLSDRALNILALLDNKSIGTRPIVFITHSMGGLLVKEMLRHAATITTRFAHIVDRTKAVVFFSTPHFGSSLADIATYLSFIFRASPAIDDLKQHQPRLRDLNLWFRNNYQSLNLQSRIFYETKETSGFRVVNEASSDPGIASVSPIPIDADHIGICKPESYDDIVVGQTLKLIDSAIPSATYQFRHDLQFEPDFDRRETPDTEPGESLAQRLRRALAARKRPAAFIALALLGLAGAISLRSESFCTGVWFHSYCDSGSAAPFLQLENAVSVSQNIGDPAFVIAFRTSRLTTRPTKLLIGILNLTLPDGSATTLYPVTVQRNGQFFQNQYLQGIDLSAEPAGTYFAVMFTDDQPRKLSLANSITQKYGPTWLAGCMSPAGLSEAVAKELATHFDGAFIWQEGSYRAAMHYRINGHPDRSIAFNFGLTQANQTRMKAMSTRLSRCGGLMLDPSQLGNLNYKDSGADNFTLVTPAAVKF
jgi:pimeloyl-ACP methyl ester carboxylesterase